MSSRSCAAGSTRDRAPHAWITHSGEETEALAARLLGTPPASRLRPAVVIELRGDLGTGKSTFARGVLRALGVNGTHQEPELHAARELRAAGRCTRLHLDLYRLNDPEELEHLGLADYHRPGFLWLIEWPERAAGGLPRTDLRFEFSIVDAGHRIERIETFMANK